MSRTDKDDPYWVKVNRASVLEREPSHHHNLFGVPQTRYRKVRDSSGNVVYEDILSYRIISRLTGEEVTDKAYYFTREYVEKHFPNTYRIEEYISGRRIKYENVTVFNFADHCTIDEPATRGYSWQGSNPCYNYLSDERPYYSRHIPKENRKIFHGKMRRITRDSLTSFVKEANNNGYDDETDFNDDNVPVVYREKYGWWD